MVALATAASLVQAGLEHAVICPGSRSTPFAWALAETPGLTCHGLVDERVAAFFALGIGRVTGRAALVLCTSGSAAANFFPAVVEASLARVPLLLLTADRPLELQAAEAAQTIDQVRLFGTHARHFFDLGAPDAAPSSLAGMQRLVVQALAATRAPEPGPVHLERPRAQTARAGRRRKRRGSARCGQRVSALLARGVTRLHAPSRGVAPGAVRELTQALGTARRALVVVGPLPAHAPNAGAELRALAERLALPVYAEATSGLRFTADPGRFGADGLDWVLRSPERRRALAPDCIVRIGGTPTSAGLETLLAEHPQTALHVIAEHGHPDPLGRAKTLTLGALDGVLSGLAAACASHEPHAEHRACAASVAVTNGRVWQTVARVLDAEPPDSRKPKRQCVPPSRACRPAESSCSAIACRVRLVDAFGCPRRLEASRCCPSAARTASTAWWRAPPARRARPASPRCSCSAT